MILTYTSADRTLSIRGVITQHDGEQLQITEKDVVMYSSDAGGFEGIPLGMTVASSFTLELDNVGRKYTPEQFDDAEVHMWLGIFNGTEFEYSDFGVWYVDSSSAPEQSVSITLFGYDALSSKFEATYIDDKSSYPTTIGSMLRAACTAAGIPLRDISFPNAAVQISKMPAWQGETKLRDIVSYCAICAGGFARIAENGELEILSFADGRTHALSPDNYKTFVLDGGSAFKFNSIEAKFSEEDEDYSRFAVDASIRDNATNTVQLDYNPLLTKNIVQSIVTELAGFTATAGSVIWVGDPTVRCGDFFEVTLLNGTVKRLMATSLTFTFHGGFSCEVACDLPAINTVSSASYSTAGSLYDTNGNIRVTRISGLDRKIISATAGHFETLTSTEISTDRLMASLLQAIELHASNIDASSVDTDVLTATLAKIVQATVDKITAGSVTTDELYAAIAKIITLRVKQINAENITTDELYAALADVILLRAQQITADNIETDELAAAYAEITTLLVENINAGNVQADKLGAALANFVTMYAGTGEFDFATIQNLVAKALSLEQASAESVYIKNLAVTSANLLSATLGKLVLKGDDGRYYRVLVGSDGSISTEEIVPTDDEIQNGQTSGGQQIVETSMNVGSLNASNLQASSAVINQILTTALTAEKITAADALIASASIPALYTTSIKALGAGLDLSANEYIQLIVGEVDSKIAAKSNVFRGETAPDDANVNDLWIVPSTGYTYQLAAQDGTPALWQRVKDSELEDAAKAASDAAETAQIAAQAAQDKANQNAEDMAQTVTRFEGELSSLQSQIDGSITTWFEYGAPTYYNYPASQWTTADMRNAHLGDLYYDRYTGYCYRWQLSGSAYEWTRISDTDVTKALNDAAAAKDVADSKRRVFVSTPTPPYDIGDLWVQGANGDILRCQKPRAAGGYYYASDWVPASKYTDDTKANENAQIIAQHTAELQLMDSRITARVEQSISEVSGELETQISSSFSEVTQTVDELRVVMEQNRAADKSELRTYLRYADGTLELGRSGSRYVARTSDNGFVVLQDGAEMAAMVQNTVSAPVVEARRQFVLGEYAIRIGADGGILFV